ncbi:permease [candidate division KSB1 bacterium]|nr:MAG: permease [candidate division KSB1 bacterium]
MKKNKNSSKNKISIIVLAVISAAYVVLYFTNGDMFEKSIGKFLGLVLQIAPFLLLVFIIMFFNFWFLKPEMIKKYLGEQSGLKGYIFAILAGIISVGSVYMWYPLLKELRGSGMSDKLIAIFIYNRSIKLHLLPLMILYFGLTFTSALTAATILFSLIIGFVVHKFTLEKTDSLH